MGRSEVIRVRVSPEEAATLRASAQTLGLSVSAFVRLVAQAPPPTSPGAEQLRRAVQNPPESQVPAEPPKNGLYLSCPNQCEVPGRPGLVFRRLSAGRCPYCNRSCV